MRGIKPRKAPVGGSSACAQRADGTVIEITHKANSSRIAGQQRDLNRFVKAGNHFSDGGVQYASIIGRKRTAHNDPEHAEDPTYKEAPIGFEPMVADLQSAGLATCLRRLAVSMR